MTTPDLLLATACGGAASLAFGLTAACLPRVRLATRHGVLVAALLGATLAPVVAIAASVAGVGLRAPSAAPATPATSGSPSAAAAPEAERDPSAPRPAAPLLSAAPAGGGASASAPSTPAGRFPWAEVVVLVWAAGAGLGLVSVLLGLARAARLRRSLLPCVDPRARDAYQADPLPVPATIGILRPVVVLPADLPPRLDDADLAAVLRHECSHALRRDPLWGLVGRLARALHWPNPLVHVAARRFDALAESLADAHAIAPDPGGAVRYAACLLRLAEIAVDRRPPAGARAVLGPRSTLSSRVEALLDPRTCPDPRPPAGRTLSAALAGLAALAAVVLVLPRAPRAVAGDAPPTEAAAGRAGLAYEGRVVDPEGRPVEGAVVWADAGSSFQVMLEEGLVPWRRLAPDPFAAAETWNAVRAPRPTGPDGRFAVEGVGAAAGGTVRAVHPRFAAGVVGVPGTAATKEGRVQVGDVVLRRGASITVRILRRDDTPAAGAWFAAQPEGRELAVETAWPWSLGRAPGHARAARADDRGFATIEGLEPGVGYAIAAFSDDAPPAQARWTAGEDLRACAAATCGWGGAVDVGGGRVALVVHLLEGRSLRVVAVDRGTGGPRPGCRVDVGVPEEGGPVSIPRPAPLATATTGDDGSATLRGLGDGEYEVTVTPADQASVARQEPPPFSVRARAKAGGDPLQVALDPVRAVRVLAVDAATGARIEDVRILLSPVWPGYDSSGGFPADVSFPRRGLDAVASREGEGADLVTGVRPGRWTLRAYRPGYRPAAADAFEVAAAGDAPLVRVGLDKATSRAVGRVVARRTKAPVAGASVRSYEWIPWLLDGPKSETKTDPDGRFQFDGMIGKDVPLRLEVAAAGYLDAVCADAERNAEDAGEIALTAAATIQGVYVDARTREPIPHAAVDLWRGEGRSGLKDDFGASTQTDAQGRFRLEGIGPGRWTLAPHGGSPRTLTIEEGASEEVTLVSGGSR